MASLISCGLCITHNDSTAGAAGTSGTVGSPNIVYEALFTVNGYIEFRVGPQERFNGTSGVSTG
jgi:hypothetical protein